MGGGGFFSTPRVCTADGFICILSQPGLTNMRALSTMESCCCHPSQKKKKQAPPRRLSLVVLEIMPPTCPFNRVLPEIREAAALRGLSGKRYRGKDEGEGLHAAFHF